ncbi:MAG: DUF2497 domain-containing protein [Alphaproteobacteria bacterium]|nr:DUF2497 domain-containing protein [Alphaproteobacteria bacterium]
MTLKRDHEEDMSMEEILASIRKFVSDIPSEDPHKRVYKGDLSEAVVVPPAGHTAGRQRKAEYLDEHGSDILDLTNPLGGGKSNFNSSGERGNAARQPSRDEVDDSIMNLTNPLESKKGDRLNSSLKETLSPESDASLGSSHTISASANSLSRLAHASKTIPAKKFSNLVDQRNLTLDQLIQDMVRPLIKQWIDTHLPSLVEEMVSKEIKRITKHL